MSIAALHKALLSAKEVDEFIVAGTRKQTLLRQLQDDPRTEYRDEHSSRARIFIDRERGRGGSTFSVTPGADLRSLISQSAARALGAIGPSWRLRPPAAPALLQLHDTNWALSLDDSAQRLREEFQVHQPSSLQLLSGSLSLSLTDTRALVSNGFDNQYRSTRLRITARVQAETGSPVHMQIGARHQDGLRWQAVFEEAIQRSERAGKATDNQSGPCDVLLLASAYHPRDEADYGLWTALVQQSQAGLAASGLARYQIGQGILAEPARGDTLTLRSDGARDFGWRSAPFDDDGQAVRRFPIVEEGKAAGQSVNYIEAARQRIDANGGVRDLIMAPGTTAIEELRTPGKRRLVVVHQVVDLHAESRGGICMRIGNSEELIRDAAGATTTRATQGGVLCGNLYRWLQDARYSSEQDDLLWFSGPRGIRFNQLQLHL